MKELLFRRKAKFIQYLFATFLFIIDHFAQIGLFSLILGAIERGDTGYYKTVILITIGFIIYSPLNFLISRMLRIRYMRDTILDVRKQAFDKIIHMTFKQYSQKSKDVYISNLINDINTFENKFFLSLLNFLINAGMFVISLVILIVLDYKLAIGMLLFSAFLFLLAGFFTKKSTALEQEVSTANEQFTTEMSNTFQGLEILKLNHIEEKFKEKSLDTIGRLERKKFAANVFTDMQMKIVWILAFVASVAALIYLTYGFLGGMTLALGGLLFQLCTSISRYLINAFPMWNQMKASISIYNKIAEPEEETLSNLKGTKPFHFEKKIKVSNVNFYYDKKQILKNASFTIEKGRKYLIKGASGAGKSTLMNLLAMSIDDYSGVIEADGANYKELSEKSFHDKVAFIYQDVFLFEDTIQNNITLYKDIPMEQIQYAAKVCGLEAVIQDKKNGIHEMLTENGKNLSGGQRQRISIARAIAKNAEILFVDEGTSSLNEELGKEIEQVFLELDNTVIAISHRFYEGVTDKYDYVLEIKNGLIHTFPAKDYFDEVITC
ncbi:ABC transporter permease [Anaerocolumna cellulosilytica]|uniref:ABC transporter permease n=1 Tax=Anaerocolumna cellulosilytica TaxID=433286 RepID=A0A6S6QRX5_9FIRM|nr:ABC transporter ATP-binding protein [Anaerocolumna cellulosilytica]MBB5197285.1 ABC-type multidrug transport system fused ATPase/permease subunit [Anaerocolumna cellulosilytica]BCJ94093.1 ABC transporter permease [Anaerocolumna cellulosilytica]